MNMRIPPEKNVHPSYFLQRVAPPCREADASGYPIEHRVHLHGLTWEKPTRVDRSPMRPSFLRFVHLRRANRKRRGQGGTKYFLHAAPPFAGRFIEAVSEQRGTAERWFAMGHHSRPVSRSERCAVPTEMGEGREPGVGQGSVDEGGGQFSLTTPSPSS